MSYRIPITDVHIQGKKWKALPHEGYLEIVPSGNSLVIKIAELKDFKDGQGRQATIDIIAEDELLHFKRPSKETQDPVFSFKFAVLRPTQWLSAALPRVNPDQAAVFECDVLSDTEDLNEHQIQNLASSIANINKVPLVTLSSDAISQYPPSNGVMLWQETADLWGMLKNDRRCFELCLRPMYNRRAPESAIHLWEPSQIELVESIPAIGKDDAIRTAHREIREATELPDLDSKFHIIPMYDEHLWSIIIIFNISAFMQEEGRGGSEVCVRRFLMEGVEDAGVEDFVSKFLQVCKKTEHIASFTVKTIPETLYTSGFLVAKLLKWGIDNEAGLEKILIDCAIPPYVFQ